MTKSSAAPTAGAVEPASYEAARDELVDVVRRLESGGLTLEESLALWERGEQLAQLCQAWLDGARERLAARRPDSLDVEASASNATTTVPTDVPKPPSFTVRSSALSAWTACL